MNTSKHWTIYSNNSSDIQRFITNILEGNIPSILSPLKNLKGDVLTSARVDEFIQEEELHDLKITTKNTVQSLKSMSSGEQQKNVLNFLLSREPEYLILENPFDNLDTASRIALKIRLEMLASKIILIVLISRKNDHLIFIENKAILTTHGTLRKIENNSTQKNQLKKASFQHQIPVPIHKPVYKGEVLIEFINVDVTFDNNPILKNINWTIRRGEFWQLKGENGSGKTTLLSMITGENSKGYGQEFYLFGHKKGSGETIWDIKKNIGYYAPSLTYKFKGQYTVEEMLISGLNDSIGLYQIPTEQQISIAKQWLRVLNIWTIKDILFSALSIGNQRLIMIARAMIKQPLLLILDEPTENLDDESAALFVALTNKIAKETNTAIIYVSHRNEKGLYPKFIFELRKTNLGSIGNILNENFNKFSN